MSDTTPQMTENNYVPLTVEQIEAMVEEVIESNSVWRDPLPSQVWAVMDIVREAMEQAWDEGWRAHMDYLAAVMVWNASEGAETPEALHARNPHRVSTPPTPTPAAVARATESAAVGGAGPEESA